MVVVVLILAPIYSNWTKMLVSKISGFIYIKISLFIYMNKLKFMKSTKKRQMNINKMSYSNSIRRIRVLATLIIVLYHCFCPF